MILGCRKLDRNARASAHTVERFQGRLNAGPVQRESMDLGKDEIRGQQEDSPLERLTEEPVRLQMVLIAPAPQRDPGAAIDEKLSGSVCDALGIAVVAARQ